MRDLYDRYLRGVNDLLQAIEPADEAYLRVLTLQGRLAQAIAETRQYGPTDGARAEIARVTGELDRLCLGRFGRSFRSFSGIDVLPQTSSPTIYHNLPQRNYEQFVGREQELVEIHRLLSPTSRHFLITVDGIGGIGKSTLALEAAYRYLEKADDLPIVERFEAIIWTSAKQDVLTAEGIAQRAQSLRALEDIYTTISITLEREDITRARPEEQPELVRRALARQRTLLIVDNLETVDDEAVLSFLRELPVPTKAIVTTRHHTDIAYPIRLGKMPWEDAEDLIARECNRKGVILDDGQAHRLYDSTGGIPLAIVWSISQMGFGYGIEAVLNRLGQPLSDLIQFCFDSTVQSISLDTRRIMMALALFATDATKEALGFVTRKDLPGLDRGLVELSKLSLVSEEGKRYSMLPITLSMAKNELDRDREFSDEGRERWVEYFMELVDQNSGEFRHEDKGEFELERRNILDVITWCQKHRPRVAVRLTEQFGPFLFRKGHWSDLNLLCDAALGLARADDSKLSKARILSILGRVKMYQRLMKEAEHHLSQATRIFQELGKTRPYLHTLSYLAIATKESGNAELALAMLEEALQKSRTLGLVRQLAKTENIIAAHKIDLEDYEDAESCLQEAIEILEAQPDGEYIGLTASYRLMGRIQLENQEFEEALKWFSRSLVISQETGITIDQAYSLKWLGLLFKRTGKVDSSLRRLSEAAQAFERLGMIDEAV